MIPADDSYGQSTSEEDEVDHFFHQLRRLGRHIRLQTASPGDHEEEQKLDLYVLQLQRLVNKSKRIQRINKHHQQRMRATRTKSCHDRRTPNRRSPPRRESSSGWSPEDPYIFEFGYPNVAPPSVLDMQLRRNQSQYDPSTCSKSMASMGRLKPNFSQESRTLQEQASRFRFQNDVRTPPPQSSRRSLCKSGSTSVANMMSTLEPKFSHESRSRPDDYEAISKPFISRRYCQSQYSIGRGEGIAEKQSRNFLQEFLRALTNSFYATGRTTRRSGLQYQYSMMGRDEGVVARNAYREEMERIRGKKFRVKNSSSVDLEIYQRLYEGAIRKYESSSTIVRPSTVVTSRNSVDTTTRSSVTRNSVDTRNSADTRNAAGTRNSADTTRNSVLAAPQRNIRTAQSCQINRSNSNVITRSKASKSLHQQRTTFPKQRRIPPSPKESETKSINENEIQQLVRHFENMLRQVISLHKEQLEDDHHLRHKRPRQRNGKLDDVIATQRNTHRRHPGGEVTVESNDPKRLKPKSVIKQQVSSQVKKSPAPTRVSDPRKSQDRKKIPDINRGHMIADNRSNRIKNYLDSKMTPELKSTPDKVIESATDDCSESLKSSKTERKAPKKIRRASKKRDHADSNLIKVNPAAISSKTEDDQKRDSQRSDKEEQLQGDVGAVELKLYKLSTSTHNDKVRMETGDQKLINELALPFSRCSDVDEIRKMRRVDDDEQSSGSYNDLMTMISNASEISFVTAPL